MKQTFTPEQKSRIKEYNAEYQNTPQRKAYQKEYATRPETIEYMKKWRDENPDKVKQYQLNQVAKPEVAVKRRIHNSLPEVKERRREYHNRPEVKERKKENSHKCLIRLWSKVFDIYGRKCVCCGEGNLDFLTIDHINEDGAIERKQSSSNAALIWKAAKEADIRKYQILCYNCNIGRSARGIDGVCPHKLPMNWRFEGGK